MADSKDVDETRRLLYMALVAHRTDRYNLVGTLVNALVHHSGLDEDPAAAADRLVSIVNGEDDHRQWASELIARLGS